MELQLLRIGITSISANKEPHNHHNHRDGHKDFANKGRFKHKRSGHQLHISNEEVEDAACQTTQ